MSRKPESSNNQYELREYIGCARDWVGRWIWHQRRHFRATVISPDRGESLSSKIRRLIDAHPHWASASAVMCLLVLTGLFYLRPEILMGTHSLVGLDYDQLHMRRMAFARASLLSARHTIPAWYPHEVLGTPFAANLQSFPWIPTRLVLLALDPSAAYAVGVAMAAALGAIFTFLYCRGMGLSRLAAVAAGGTFAGAGYFASRVLAGHLPLLEAYPALPLLLWLVDRCFSPVRLQRRRLDLAALALCTTCVVLAGHPQIPAYSVASGLLYIAWRKRSWTQARVAGAIALGAGLAFAVWWPMLLLIGRSTRVEHLAATDNDVAMPYARLVALISPGIHGWADPVTLAEKRPFIGFPNPAYFWDTASYIGILPIAVMLALLIACVVRRRMPDARWRFLVCLGLGAFVCSLPLAAPMIHLAPGTFLRSPARLLYLSTFCAAVAMGVGIDAFRRARWPVRASIRTGLIVAALCLHFVDLWGFAHLFVQVTPRKGETPEFEAILDREVGDGRIGEERDGLIFSYADRYDDAGGFDSILLSRFNRGLLALAGAPRDLNQQEIDASEFPVKALEATGVRFVITTQDRTDLQLAGSTDEANLYRVPHPAPRVEFFPGTRTSFVEEQRIPEMFAADPKGNLLLPQDLKRYAPGYEVRAVDHPEPEAIHYLRPSSDEILVRVNTFQPGFINVLESYDPGWTAMVDGVSAPLAPANGFAMGVPVPAGSHEVRLRYRTPGRSTGFILSMLCLGLLVLLIGSVRPSKNKYVLPSLS